MLIAPLGILRLRKRVIVTFKIMGSVLLTVKVLLCTAVTYPESERLSDVSKATH